MDSCEEFEGFQDDHGETESVENNTTTISMAMDCDSD